MTWIVISLICLFLLWDKFNLCFCTIALKISLLFRTIGHIQVRNESSILGISLISSVHLTALNYIFPVIWLQRCIFLASFFNLGCQIVDFATSTPCQFIDSNPAISITPFLQFSQKFVIVENLSTILGQLTLRLLSVLIEVLVILDFSCASWALN